MRWPTPSGVSALGSNSASGSAPVAPPPPTAERLVLDGTSDDKADRWFLCIVFIAAAIAHFAFATRNWHWGFMIGHEFRQAQTAIISYYIDQQNNFSLHYETPIMGKPWEVPLEFPLYEWGVVKLSRLTGRPHFESARTISLASVYLALPAIYLLLGQAGLAWRRRLLVMSLYLATPVYLFYGRAFLIDTTAMMFSVWFLATFVQMMRSRRLGWLIACALAGTAGGLIKSLTFFVWLVPAFLYGAWWLASDLRGRDWAAARRTIAWGFGAVLLPVIAVTWWVRFTDAIKAPHASAYIFTSHGLTHGNFGMYDLTTRVSKQTWSALFECWSMAVAKPWAIGAILLGGLLLGRGFRARLIGAFALFIGAQMMFPNAYAYQDYYFTACTVFAVVAFGFAMNGVFSSGLPRWCRWPLVLAPFAAFYAAYAGQYYRDQSWQSHGGTGLTIALRDYLPRDSVIIGAGADWSAIIPYYSQHRALMIRNGLDTDQAYLNRALTELADEDVSALVLAYNSRHNRALVEQVANRFHTDTEPTFSYPMADVYVSEVYRDKVLERMSGDQLPEGIVINAQRAKMAFARGDVRLVTAAAARNLFPMVSPAPTKYQFKFGHVLWPGETPNLGVHPDTALWVPPPPRAREAVWEFGIIEGAYQGGNATDGVEFVIEAESDGGRKRLLFSRHLDPIARPKDRGLQHETIPLDLRPGETLVFRTRPHNNYAFDWAYTRRINVH